MGCLIYVPLRSQIAEAIENTMEYLKCAPSLEMLEGQGSIPSVIEINDLQRNQSWCREGGRTPMTARVGGF